MVSPEWLAALARYNRWMNEKLCRIAGTLSDDVRKRDCGAFFKSIHGTFNHLLVADRIWLGRFQGVALPDGSLGPGGIRALDQELYSSFDEFCVERAATDAELSAWVEDLTPERLAATFVFQRLGQRNEVPLWWAVSHVFNHQTHHRGQITTLLNQLGHDPGVTDLYAMLRAEGAPAP